MPALLEGLDMKKTHRNSVFPNSNKKRTFFDFKQLNGLDSITTENLKKAEYQMIYSKEDRKQANEYFFARLSEVAFD